MPPPALLLVFSDPGSGVSEEEFTDWYDNEHVPLRIDIPAFQNWTRWKASDGQKPAWAASYDITSYEDTLKPPYATLADTRSEREKRILREVDVLERRTYELMDTPVPPPSALYDPKKPSRYIGFASAEIKPGGDEIYNKWYDEEHIPMMSKVKGWVRSRRFVLKDWARVGVEGQTNQTPVFKYLAVHEWDSLETVTSPEVQTTFATPLKAEADKVLQARQLRHMEYYKHWKK